MIDIDVELAGIDFEKEVRAAELEEREVRPGFGPVVVLDVHRDERRNAAGR
jgi:hypothetical protein